MRKLLVITLTYNSFVKDPIEIMSEYFDTIDVFVRHNPISELSNIFPIHYLEPFTKKSLIDAGNKPSNINIDTTSTFYIPIDSQIKKLGECHFRSLEKSLQNFDYNLIHSHFIWSSGYVGVKLKEKYNIPLVITAHGFDVYNYPFKDDGWRTRIENILNNTDHIITVSNKNLELLKRLNIRTPIKVIPNGFKDNLFYPQDLIQCRKILGLPLDKKIILTIGHLIKIKNHKLLVESINMIIKNRKDILCIIIGNGNLKTDIERQIKKLDLASYIKLVGWKPHNEIPIWINACDMFVLPSLNEGNPTVMFESLGCGKPFIGTKVGGIPEIIISDDYGLLAEGKDDSEDFAKNILIALNKDWNYEKISKYSKQFSWNILSKEILDVYFKLLIQE